MKHFYTLLCLALILPFTLSAQADYRKAQVKRTDGDTLDGYVNLREWNLNPDFFLFKRELGTEEVTTFTPANALQLTICNLDTYLRYTGPISMNPVDVHRLPVGSDLSIQADSVFLRQIIKGSNVALFNYTDQVKTRYFVQNQATGLVQELYFSRYFDHPKASQIQVMRQYRGQLWGLANLFEYTNKQLKQKIEKSDYKEEDLIEIVQLINGKEEVTTTGDRKQTNFFAGLGLIRSSAMINDKSALISATDKSISYSPIMTLGLLSYFNQHTKRLAVRWEAGFTEVNQTAQATTQEQGMRSYTVRTYEQRYYNISVSPQLQYSLLKAHGWQLLVSGGLSINYALASTSRLSSQYHYYNDKMEEVSSPPTYSELRYNNLWYAVPVRIGTTWADRYEVTLGYNATISPGINEDVKSGSLQLGISYHLGH